MMYTSTRYVVTQISQPTSARVTSRKLPGSSRNATIPTATAMKVRGRA